MSCLHLGFVVSLKCEKASTNGLNWKLAVESSEMRQRKSSPLNLCHPLALSENMELQRKQLCRVKWESSASVCVFSESLFRSLTESTFFFETSALLALQRNSSLQTIIYFKILKYQSMSGVFYVFRPRKPLAQRQMEQGPSIYCILSCT